MSTIVSFFSKKRNGGRKKTRKEAKEKERALADSLHLSSVVPVHERKVRVRSAAVEANAKTLHKTALRCDVVSACVALLQLIHDLEPVLEWLQHPSIVVLAFDRYVRFLELRLAHEDEFLVPPLDVRYLWLLHVANPLAYTCDLEVAFGKKFDHCIVTEQDIRFYHEEDLQLTKKLWQAAFEEPYSFEELTDDLALTFESYEAFCQASYATLTEPRPASRRREVWRKFGINQRHVLFHNGFFTKNVPVLFQEGFSELCDTIVACREARHSQGLRTSDDCDDQFSIFKDMVIGAQAHTYNEFLIEVATRLERGARKGQSVPVVVEGSPGPLARLFCYAHMSHPKQYRSDCRRVLGSIVYLSDAHLSSLKVEIPDFDPAEHPEELPHVLLALSSGHYAHRKQSKLLEDAEAEAMLILEEQEFLWVASESEGEEDADEVEMQEELEQREVDDDEDIFNGPAHTKEHVALADIL